MGRRPLSAGHLPTGRGENCTPHAASHFLLAWHNVKEVKPWPPTHEGLSFLLITRGRGEFATPAWALRLGPGDLLVVNGTAGNLAPSAPGQEMILGTFSLRFEQLYPLFDCGEVPALQTVLKAFREFRHYPASTAVAVQSHQLLREVVPSLNLRHRGQLLTIAAVALSEEFALARNRGSGCLCSERHLAGAFDTLSVEQILTVPLRELGPRFGCSRRHLNRLFQQCLGMSFADLRMELRLLRAASLLRDLNSKVIDVAEECGFHHLSLFNHCFKRRFGVTPGRWRDAQERSATTTARWPDPDAPCPLRSNGLCPWRVRRVTPPPAGPEAVP